MKMPKGVSRTRAPRMTNHAGRTWDQCDVVLPDGSETLGRYDTTWGENVYFLVDSVWYRVQIYAYDDRKHPQYLRVDLRQSRHQ